MRGEEEEYRGSGGAGGDYRRDGRSDEEEKRLVPPPGDDAVNRMSEHSNENAFKYRRRARSKKAPDTPSDPRRRPGDACSKDDLTSR